MKRRNFRIAIVIYFLAFFPIIQGRAEEVIEIDPLFEYPVAPEEIESITEKSNYLVKHFWDNFNFKNKQAVDQNALNNAFYVYTTPMRLADLQLTHHAVDKMIEKLSSNPTLLFQFTKAAEENLYGPRADVWIDEIFIKFINAAVKNKKIPETRKERLRKIQAKLNSSIVGQKAPSFFFENVKGENSQYFPMATPTIIIFGNPEDTDWRLARLKMETRNDLTQTLEKGKLNILYIIPFEMENWKDAVSNYSDKWVVGYAPSILNDIDIRQIPSIFVVGSDGNLLTKNVSLNVALNAAFDLLNNP